MVGVRLAHAVDGAVLRKVVAVLCLVVGIGARLARAGRTALTSAFASWLADRSAEQVEIAPGIVTPRSFGDAAPRAPRHASRGRALRFLVHGLRRDRRARGARVRQRVADPPPRHAAARPHRLYAAVARRRQRAQRCHGLASRARSLLGVHRAARRWPPTSRNSARHSMSRFRIGDRGSAVIAVQGDISRRTIERCFPGIALAALPYYRISSERSSRIPNAGSRGSATAARPATSS